MDGFEGVLDSLCQQMRKVLVVVQEKVKCLLRGDLEVPRNADCQELQGVHGVLDCFLADLVDVYLQGVRRGLVQSWILDLHFVQELQHFPQGFGLVIGYLALVG